MFIRWIRGDLCFPVFQFLFLLSAILGTVVAVNPADAIGRLILIAVGLALSVAAARLPTTPHTVRLGRIIFAALPVVVALYFFLTNDWAARIGKLPALDPALRLLDQLQPVHGISINTNVVGGVIAAYMPLQVAALWPNLRKGIGPWLLIGISLAALLASLSRSAWFALAAISFAALVWHRLSGVPALPRRRWVWLGLMAAALAVFVAFLAITSPGQRLFTSIWSERSNIWADSIQLALDTPFTGIGLGHFETVYSSYVLLVHVPFLYFAHNILLDIWLGQGLLGLAAFVGWLIAAVVRHGAIQRAQSESTTHSSASLIRFAALASLGVILIHGMLDDPWYGYSAVALPLLFVPLGLLARHMPVKAPVPILASRFAIELRLMVIGLAVFGGVLLIRFSNLYAAALTNVGALRQQRAELWGYSAEKFGMQDAVRRDIDLQPVIAQYEAALQIDPGQPAAHRRLGQIALARKDIDAACAHFRAAWDSNPANRATRQFMGECAALDGDVATAERFWRSVDINQGQLQLRYAWYNDFIADKVRAVLISAATNTLK